MKRSIVIAIALVLMIATGGFAGENYKIGVLAKRGPVKAMEQWKATADFLNQKIPGKTFEIVPLDFDAVNPALANGEVDFFLVNSSMFVTAKVRFGASAIATMINSRQGQPLKSFGQRVDGVIVRQRQNNTAKGFQGLALSRIDHRGDGRCTESDLGGDKHG